MSSGRDKRKEGYYQQQTQDAMSNYSADNPLQSAINKRAQARLDWGNSTAPKDVTTAPGFSDSLDIYGNAQNFANEQQHGGGAMRLADSNSGYSDQLKSLNSFNRFNERAEGLSDAFQQNRAEALGLAQNSISASDAKKLNTANLAMTQENNYYQRPQKQSFWTQMLGGALGMGSAYVTGGVSTLGRGKSSVPGSIGYAPPHG